MRYFMFCLAIIMLCGCATTGEFVGRVRTPDGSVVYTIDGEFDAETRPDWNYVGGYTVFGLSVGEILFLLGGAGVLGGGGLAAKKVCSKNGKNAKQKKS